MNKNTSGANYQFQANRLAEDEYEDDGFENPGADPTRKKLKIEDEVVSHEHTHSYSDEDVNKKKKPKGKHSKKGTLGEKGGFELQQKKDDGKKLPVGNVGVLN